MQEKCLWYVGEHKYDINLNYLYLELDFVYRTDNTTRERRSDFEKFQ